MVIPTIIHIQKSGIKLRIYYYLLWNGLHRNNKIMFKKQDKKQILV